MDFFNSPTKKAMVRQIPPPPPAPRHPKPETTDAIQAKMTSLLMSLPAFSGELPPSKASKPLRYLDTPNAARNFLKPCAICTPSSKPEARIISSAKW